MKYIKFALIALLAIVLFMPQSLAITVDGVKSPGEWNEGWAYGQDRNASHPAPVFPYGDRVEMEQGCDTGIINSEDPRADSGPAYDDTMATVGPFESGFDQRRYYAHFDQINDTLYGMVTVYGKPGDLDGDNDIGEQCIANGDCMGDAGPNGLLGIGSGETFTVTFVQGGATAKIIIGQNNNWSENIQGFAYSDVSFMWTNDQPDGADPDSVFEMEIHNISSYFDINLGADPVDVCITSGGIMDIPGEDRSGTRLFFPRGKVGDRVWLDGDCNVSNGVQDPGEPGIPGVTVRLYHHDGAFIKSTTTNATGYYLFVDLERGCYDIVIDPPAGLEEVAANAGPDDKDSDGINNRIDNVCLTPDKMVDLTNDFGFCERPSVPALSLMGLMMLAGLLGIVGIFGIRMKR